MSTRLDSSVNQRFSSRLGLLLSVLGIAVGTGNIWRFPRIAAQIGGEKGAGAFLIAWLCFLFLWSFMFSSSRLTILPSILARKKPFFRSSPKSSLYSPFLPLTFGLRSIILDCRGNSRIFSVISCGLCLVIFLPH